MHKDQIVATVMMAVAAGILLTRDPEPEGVQDRLIAMGITYLMVLFWRPLGRLPNFSLVARFASDYKTANMGAIWAIISWLLFLLMMWFGAFVGVDKVA